MVSSLFYRFPDPMKSKKYLIPFYLVVAVYLSAMALNQHLIQLAFKPLIVGSLLFCFLMMTKEAKSALKARVIAALLFCMAGDIFLMFNRNDELFFILGLACFLMGHVFYIAVFSAIVKRKRLPAKPIWMILVTAYVIGLLYLLLPEAGALALPVVSYSIVIGSMLVLALHLLPLKRKGLSTAAGAALFVISDSVIAINKLYQAIPHDRWIVMITYIAAQFLIVRGIIQYMKTERF